MNRWPWSPLQSLSVAKVVVLVPALTVAHSNKVRGGGLARVAEGSVLVGQTLGKI